MARKSKQIQTEEEVIQESAFGKVHKVIDKTYNSLVRTIGLLLDNLSFLLSKLFKPLIYTLEGLGVYYVLYMLTKYEVGLGMIKAGNIDGGKAYVDALISMATASNNIILGMAVALPTFMGAMKVAKRKLIP